VEKIETTVFKSPQEGSAFVAQEVINVITENNKMGKTTVLGLATGASPIKFYQELVRLHQTQNVSFKNVVTFNLDEYYPMDPAAIQSYHYFMYQNLFNHIDILPKNIHIPNGLVDIIEVNEYCESYESIIDGYGGIDIQILGIGRTGHIGFNEPGSSPKSKTRLVTLDKKTRTDNAKDFTSEDNVPRRAITMGVGTILKARKIYLFAWGDKKAEVVRDSVEGPKNWNVPATFLQDHPNTEFVLDTSAAQELTRIKTPWVNGVCEWNNENKIKAVCWLGLQLNKPVLKLTDEDYNQNGMGELVAQIGSAYELNLSVFRHLRDTITGWPGGKPGTQEINTPERAEPFPKRSLIFSPHPDDDVVGMGGTLVRLVDQGHDVHVAYQTSGSKSVHDEDVYMHLGLFSDLANLMESDSSKSADKVKALKKYLLTKVGDEATLNLVKKFKGIIRRAESASASKFCGVNESNMHFLTLPFYEKNTLSNLAFDQEDVDIVVKLLQKIKPHQIFISADFVNPQGTKRFCYDIIIAALNQVKAEKWSKDCWVWMYRGAEQEWQINETQMNVPLSPDEALKKKQAILKHYSRKDGSYFTGDDNRDIWKKTEDKNKHTADVLNILGLPEYEAVECFKKLNWR
jgi:glucosamine-6-phosphate deaminase